MRPSKCYGNFRPNEDPEDAPTTHYLLGSAYAGSGDHANAAREYIAAVAKAEEMAVEVLATARLGAGHYSFLTGRYDDAVRHLSAWRDTTATPHPGTLMELALAYSRTGANAEAVAVAEGVVGGSDEATLEPEWFEMLADFYYGQRPVHGVLEGPGSGGDPALSRCLGFRAGFQAAGTG